MRDCFLFESILFQTCTEVLCGLEAGPTTSLPSLYPFFHLTFSLSIYSLFPPSKIQFLFFFFLRKISPELIFAASPPLCAEQDWPWADIHAHLPLLYMWDACHSMVCQAVPCLHLGSKLANPGLPKWNVCTWLLRHWAGPPRFSFFFSLTVMLCTHCCSSIFPTASSIHKGFLRLGSISPNIFCLLPSILSYPQRLFSWFSYTVCNIFPIKLLKDLYSYIW